MRQYRIVKDHKGWIHIQRQVRFLWWTWWEIYKEPYENTDFEGYTSTDYRDLKFETQLQAREYLRKLHEKKHKDENVYEVLEYYNYDEDL